ncbi:MAG TPA: hypothetical protein VKU41_24725 [Polyangiaceae bacterium]|nr:hypothetical protein [Polyangiaceae bacterium]
MIRAAAVALAPMVLVACATGPARPSTPARTRAGDWLAMTWEERHDVMTFAVLPNMARAFQRFRGSVAPDLTCRTCHGPDAEAVAYRMPHGLSALDPSRLPARDDGDPNVARTVRFMQDEVTPAMADLLGVPLARPGEPLGFSCFHCHPSR